MTVKVSCRNSNTEIRFWISRCKDAVVSDISVVSGGQTFTVKKILIQSKMSLTVGSLFLSATLPSPVGERVSITVSGGWSHQLIPAWLHYGALTISDGVSDFHQIRLKLLLSASVPGALPDNERSAGNKMEHIFSSDAAKKKKKLFTLIRLYEMTLWRSPSLKAFIRFCRERRERWEKAYPKVLVSGNGPHIKDLSSLCCSSPQFFHLHPFSSSLLSLLPQLSFRDGASPRQGC